MYAQYLYSLQALDRTNAMKYMVVFVQYPWKSSPTPMDSYGPTWSEHLKVTKLLQNFT